MPKRRKEEKRKSCKKKKKEGLTQTTKKKQEIKVIVMIVVTGNEQLSRSLPISCHTVFHFHKIWVKPWGLQEFIDRCSSANRCAYVHMCACAPMLLPLELLPLGCSFCVATLSAGRSVA